ncbi:chitobiase/beta-hexosaminidase C-terminal domain-containing protein [Microbacterium sp. S1037]
MRSPHPLRRWTALSTTGAVIASLAVAGTVSPATADTTATISVDTATVVQNDFLGIGVNVIPSALMERSRGFGYSDADWAVDAERIATIRPKVARVWFQIDWMEPEKGVYTWDSDRMKAFYAYLDAFKAAGTDIELNFGWKVGSTVHDWFGIPGVDPWTSAPADNAAYAASASALIDQLKNVRGYDNVKYLTYYNEPNGSWDFEAPGDQQAAYVQMAQAVHQRLVADGLRDEVEIWGPEETGAPAWTTYMAQNGGDAFDQYSFHTYGDSYGSVPTSINARKSVAGGKPVNMSEFGWSDDNASGWDSGYANYVIAGANLGLHSLLVWQLNGTWTVDPDGDTNGTYNMWDALPLGLEPRKTFLSAGLLNRYIPAHSQVLQSSSSTADVRTAAFRDAAGEYTLLVESKGTAPTDLDVSFGSTAIGKDFHRVVYDNDLVPDENALLPAVSATLPAGTGFSDQLDEGYSFAIYTTADPAVQVRVSDADPTVASGSTLALTADVIDGAAGVTWSVDGTGNGSVSSAGVYTPPSVDSEREVAVRATSTADPTSSAVAIVTVTPQLTASRVDPVQFDLDSGVYAGSEVLTLSTPTAGAQIRYTTDGSEPTASSTLYERPLILPETSTKLYRAAAFATGKQASGITSRLFKVGGVSEGPDGYTLCANEGGECFFSGQQSVAFGGDGLFTYQAKTGPVSCDAATLGDPNPNGTQKCYVSPELPSSYPLVTLTNAGFEKPGGTKSKTGPFTNGWTFNSRSGIQNGQGPLGPPTPSEGQQVGYLKTDAGVQGTISQEAAFPAGEYQVVFALSGRSGYPAQSFDVLYDDTVIGSFAVGSTSSYETKRTPAFTSDGGRHTITFRATAPSGDRTAFLDAVRIEAPVPPEPAQLQNTGFEAPSTTGVKSAPFTEGWSFVGRSGIQHNGSAFGAPSAPEGTQTALLQSRDGQHGSFSQTLDMTAGDYTLTYQASRRPGYSAVQTVQVLIDGVVVDSFAPPTATFTSHTSPTFTVSAGDHEIMFRGSAASGDATAFIDQVVLSPIP